jgi:hypothetical protein
MSGKLIEKAGLDSGGDDIHSLETVTPLAQFLSLLMHAQGLCGCHDFPLHLEVS